ncbi:MAG: cobalt-precorrin-4/precorrin-4 C(11)-methyltransferase, partial [Ruminococcus sp.]|nr:cobalt-precorrin-4/precorrin-4 C(11)-methyltransferase [Ruminococcus sp.]
MVHFVGAGSGAADLITIRGKNLLEAADVVIYAGSLVNPELLNFTRNGCEIHNSALMTLDEVIDVMEKAEKKGRMTVRLHTGDPSVYGAIREQMERLEKLGIIYDVCPGVSSFCGAAAALKAEYTLPDVSQTVILTRMAGRTPVPES